MICFVIALDGEAAPVLANMDVSSQEMIFSKKVYHGTLCGKKACVIVCGVGKVNAALGAALAADRFAADAIINIGTAGALNASMNVGGIYGVNMAAEYDFDLCSINGTQQGVLNEFSERWLALDAAEGYTYKKLATGDRFNDDADDYRLLTEDFGADLRDMEGAAIAHVCAHTKTPLYIFKAVSDVAGSGNTTEQYMRNIELCYKNTQEEICNIFEAVTNSQK